MLNLNQIQYRSNISDQALTYCRDLFYVLERCFESLFSYNDEDPADTERKLNVHKTFRRLPRRLLNVLCTFNLRPVSTRIVVTMLQEKH